MWAITLKFADGFTRFWPSAIGLAAAVTSFVMLSVAVKSLWREPEAVEIAFGALEFHDVFKIYRSGPAETVALSCPQSLLAWQAPQDSHPDNVIAVKTTPIKAIPGFVPIGFSFLHG